MVSEILGCSYHTVCSSAHFRSKFGFNKLFDAELVYWQDLTTVAPLPDLTAKTLDPKDLKVQDGSPLHAR